MASTEGVDFPSDGTGKSQTLRLTSLSVPRLSLTSIYWTGVIKLDANLSPFANVFRRRHAKSQEWIDKLNKTEGGLERFSKVRGVMVFIFA